MIISYNWLCDYLPIKIEPVELSRILTSIGLEVESMDNYETYKGGLRGLVAGEIISCEKHPDADKLTITKVDIGNTEPLQIICGAANAAAGKKVIIAPVGSTIFPTDRDPVLIKKASIRGVNSEGMICAEDEIGLGKSHDGIFILPADIKPGVNIASFFEQFEDVIYEIGLTPNRTDAMSHLGVAKDVCAYLSHHEQKDYTVNFPYDRIFHLDNNEYPIEVIIEDKKACRRYSGISIKDITVRDSPLWLKQKLKSIGLKPINNIVDITNFILHETGQPLHAFDADKIIGKKIIVKNAKEGTLFRALDEKERTLSKNDLLICNEKEPMCIAGVYGGIESGVTETTKNIFLESAWFDPVRIRKTSLYHGLRTDAAARFEKGIDISNIVRVLKRAILLIKETAGGTISSDIVDIYPSQVEQTEVRFQFEYLKKLSGKTYPVETVKNILTALGFTWIRDNNEEAWIKVPYSKPDINIPADIVEEIMRIDGLDNVEIPVSITISPSSNEYSSRHSLKEKLASYLTGLGFFEIFTNTITNSSYYSQDSLKHAVKMISNLSAELGIMRPGMLETGLEVIGYNVNRRNNNLQLYEFGKTYHSEETGVYKEKNHLCIYVSGNINAGGWQMQERNADFYYLKGVCEKVLQGTDANNIAFEPVNSDNFEVASGIKIGNQHIGILGEVSESVYKSFNIKQPVFFIDLEWDLIALRSADRPYSEITRFPSVQRDLSLIIDKNLPYSQVEKSTASAKLNHLQSVNLFDVFESEKLGKDKKSMSVSFTFMDNTRTLTDKEIDEMMNILIRVYEKDLHAEIRK